MSIVLIYLLRMQEVFKSRVTAVIHSVEDVEYARLHLQTKPAIAKLVSLDALVQLQIARIGHTIIANTLIQGIRHAC